MNHVSTNPQPQLRAAPMGLFPTLGSLQEVVNYGESKLPITDKNDLFSLLMTYHNTLLSQINVRR
jgi:hypothetical protein